MFDATWDESDDEPQPSSDAPAGAVSPSASGDAELELLLERRCTVQPLPRASQPRAPQPPPSAPSVKPQVADEEPAVELGFVSPYPYDGGAQPEHFPSKVGGSPVWLLPRGLPGHESLCCRSCHRELRFLLQLYCPRPEVVDGYHRSLMLFCCGGECLRTSAGWRAFRCNLPEENPWYKEQPDGTWTAHGREQLAARVTACSRRART